VCDETAAALQPGGSRVSAGVYGAGQGPILETWIVIEALNAWVGPTFPVPDPWANGTLSPQRDPRRLVTPRAVLVHWGGDRGPLRDAARTSRLRHCTACSGGQTSDL